MWTARAMLALLLVAPYALIAIVVPGLGKEPYTARVTMSTPGPSMAQVFFDLGNGVRERDSTRLPVDAALRAYDFALSPGTLQSVRLDPGLTGGRYTITSVLILRPNHSTLATLDLKSVSILNQLSVVEQRADALVLESPPGSVDPHFYFMLKTPLTLEPSLQPKAIIAARVVGVWVLALLCLVGLETLIGKFRSTAAIQSEATQGAWLSAPTTIAVAALFSTFLATYPLLLTHRSLVSPGNGGVAMLYDHPPFVPGTNNYELEDTRGSDIGAMMWAMVPYSIVQRDAVRHGEWPLWIRQNASGRPLWGQGQSFFLDPLHWLTIVVPDVALGWDLKFVAHRLVFALGIGTAAFVATGAALPSAIAAALAPTAGLYTFRFNHPAAFSVTYAPWILVGLFLLGRAETSRARGNASLLLACATTLTLVASPPKEAVINIGSCYMAGVLSILWTSTRLHRMRSLAAAAIGGAIAVLVSAPHWLVFLDTLTQARTVYDTPSVNLATLASALGFVLGNLSPRSLQPGVNIVVVTLAVGCLMSPAYLRARQGLVACGLVALALIAVAYGVVPAALLVKVPLIGNITHFGDVMMTALVVPTLVLAAGGVTVYATSSMRAVVSYTAVLGAGACVLLYNAGGFSGFAQVEQWVVLIVIVSVLGLAHTLSCVRRTPRRAVPVAAAALVMIAVSELGGLHADTRWPFLNHLLPQPGARANLVQNSPAILHAKSADDNPVRAVGLDALLLQGSQSFYGLEGVGGPDALQLGRYEELLDAAGVARETQWRAVVHPGDLDRVGPLLDLLNVGLVLTPQGTQLPSLVKEGEDGDFWLDTARRPTAWPRAFVVDGVRRYSDVSGFVELLRQVPRPFAAVQAGDFHSEQLVRDVPAQEQAISPAFDYRFTANRTAFRVRASAPGVAVLTEAHMDGDFVALLNGRATPYLRVNHAFKGVAIPSAGEWEVSFEYRPRHWGLAWATAAVGFLLGVGVWWGSRSHPEL